MIDEPTPAAESAGGGFNPVRRLNTVRSGRLLIHGMLLQIGGTVASFVSSAVHKDDGLGEMAAYQKLMTLSWGFSFLSSAIGFIG